MEQNKTGKYLKYAIGEIVLVVIGILIALSINNWNESRKVENKKQELILNAASTIFLIHGFSAATTDMIQRQLSMSLNTSPLPASLDQQSVKMTLELIQLFLLSTNQFYQTMLGFHMIVVI